MWCAGAARLPFAMQLHATMISFIRDSRRSAELRKFITELLVSLLPGLPLKLPQQRAWVAGCCATTLQLCKLQEDRGMKAILLL